MTIDTARFFQDLETLRGIGTYRTGVHRPTFGSEDMESRHWLVEQMREVGLDASVDGIGNVFGRHPGAGPHLLAGSHIETQNHAGWLDGALGVVAALALAQSGLPVDVCAYADEEGHWGDFLGSRSLVGDLSEEDIDRATNTYDGSPLRPALEAAGLAGRPRIKLDAGRYVGALELHIEQGTKLERSGLRIGVVEGIVGIRYWRIVVEGQQDHTGGTTMEERRDAGLALVRLLAAVDEQFPQVCGEHSVWTTGRIAFEPNLPMIIPGRAEALFSFRDLSPAILARMEDRLLALVTDINRRDRCQIRLEPVGHTEPAACDPLIRTALRDAATALCPDLWQEMRSGAIHDSQVIARKVPVGMLFVPSIGGISHHWAEDTKREDLELGVRVLTEAARRLIRSE